MGEIAGRLSESLGWQLVEDWKLNPNQAGEAWAPSGNMTATALQNRLGYDANQEL